MAKTHRVSGRAVIIGNGKVLLNSFKDGLYYNFPGGGVEEGETLTECVSREVLEETGLTVYVKEMLFTLEVETTRCNISGEPHISVFFRCVLDENAPIRIPDLPDHCPDEPTSLATTEWVPISKLKEINFLPYIPDQLFNYVQTGVFSPSFISGHCERTVVVQSSENVWCCATKVKSDT